jgi:hypothetical protein
LLVVFIGAGVGPQVIVDAFMTFDHFTGEEAHAIAQTLLNESRARMRDSLDIESTHSPPHEESEGERRISNIPSSELQSRRR